MKLFFILATMYTIYLMKFKRPYCLTYEEVCDDFEHKKYIYPCNLFIFIYLNYIFIL